MQTAHDTPCGSHSVTRPSGVAPFDKAVGVVLMAGAAAAAVAGHVARDFGMIGGEHVRVLQHVHRTRRHISFDVDQRHVEAGAVRCAGLGLRRNDDCRLRIVRLWCGATAGWAAALLGGRACAGRVAAAQALPCWRIRLLEHAPSARAPQSAAIASECFSMEASIVSRIGRLADWRIGRDRIRDSI